MVYTPANVVSSGFPIDDATFTYLLTAATSVANVGGAVSLDPTAANRVMPAPVDGVIFGRLATYEDRDSLSIKTGAVQRQFKEKMPASAGHGILVGDSVVGNGGGLVKKAVAANRTIVVETGTTYVVVEQL